MGTVTLLLSCVMLTSSVLCLDQFYIFDITGDVTANDVIKKFSDYDVRYIFQVVLAKRYIVVMPQVLQSQLEGVTFPKAEVTSYVAQSSDDFYASFGARKGQAVKPDLQGRDFYMKEIEYTMEDLSLEEYSAVVKKIGDQLQKVKPDLHGYNLMGYTPVRNLAFVYKVGNSAKGIASLTGSPHYVRFRVTPVIRIQ